MDENAAAAAAAEEASLDWTPAGDSRAEDPVTAVQEAASGLAAVLPTRVEAAVGRALTGTDGVPLARRLTDVSRTLTATSEAVQRVSADLAAERMGRVQDLEVLVDLMDESTASTRADVARVDDRVAELARAVAELSGAVAALAPLVGEVSQKLDRRVRISVRTEGSSLPDVSTD